MNLCSSVTAAALRKYVYTCFPGLVYNECQVTLLFLQIYPSMSVPNNSYCNRVLYSQGDEMYEITLDLEQKAAMIEHFFS